MLFPIGQIRMSDKDNPYNLDNAYNPWWVRQRAGNLDNFLLCPWHNDGCLGLCLV